MMLKLHSTYCVYKSPIHFLLIYVTLFKFPWTHQADSVVVAQITYQSLFKLYPKLSGMTGTAKTEVWISRVDIYNTLMYFLCIFVSVKLYSHLSAGKRIFKNVSDASYRSSYKSFEYSERFTYSSFRSKTFDTNLEL